MYKLRTSLRLAVDGDLQIAAVSEALSILAGDEVRQPAASSIRSHPGSCAASRISSAGKIGDKCQCSMNIENGSL